MTYHLNQWRAEIRLSNGQSLEEAHAHAVRQLEPSPNDSGIAGSAAKKSQDERDTEEALAKLRADVWGNLYTTGLPPALAEAQLLNQVGIQPHIFFDDALYSPERRGYLLARVIIDNQLELVRRVADTVKQNQNRIQREAKQAQERAKQRNKQPPKKARRKTQRRRR